MLAVAAQRALALSLLELSLDKADDCDGAEPPLAHLLADARHVFNACVVSKLLRCLHTAWLNKAELRRLDVFQTSCLRKILRIPHSFKSRVSNAEILS